MDVQTLSGLVNANTLDGVPFTLRQLIGIDTLDIGVLVVTLQPARITYRVRLLNATLSNGEVATEGVNVLANLVLVEELREDISDGTLGRQ